MNKHDCFCSCECVNGSCPIAMNRANDWYSDMGYDVPNKLPLYQRKGRSKPNFAFLHKSAWKDIPQLAWHDQPTTDAELRAMTPPGFAWAFYEANK